MSDTEKRVLADLYSRASRPEDLPWHREEPPAALRAAVALREPGRALDLGCGAGVFSVYLSKQGWDVTGVDFLDAAVKMSQARANEEKARVRFVQADVLSFKGGPYELVLDSGCFHSLHPSERAAYRARLLEWLAPGGDFVLIHFGRRHFFDWRPIGPRRRTLPELLRELGPEFIQQSYEEYEHRTPFPIGPTVRIGEYRFRRAS